MHGWRKSLTYCASWMRELPNNAMQLTKLRAAPVLQGEVPPCAPAGQMDGCTASQLIASVRRLSGRGMGP